MIITAVTPMEVTGLDSGVTAISAGGSHTCAIHNTAGAGDAEMLAAKCWGLNSRGQLGDGSVTTFDDDDEIVDNNDRMTPVQVTGLDSDVTAISAGIFHTCAIHNGAAKCWGSNSVGRLGDGSVTTFDDDAEIIDNNDRMTPVQVTGLESDVTAISAGNAHTCALHSGVAKCWGSNGNGRLGVGELADAAIFSTTPQTLREP